MLYSRMKHDGERMDDLTAQLHSLRQKEAQAVEKVSKAEEKRDISTLGDRPEASVKTTNPKRLQHLNSETFSSGLKRQQLNVKQ